ncbi:L10-interacting MYB domain-containing protein-like [Rutidosis leptorrhynchoides]|uniref:L10-interacting MYB domain-containing protein-like n=1 Tax=Rutidosis leptorrhynchoides TaxID=125765 RepID=UPI003A9A2029
MAYISNMEQGSEPTNRKRVRISWKDTNVEKTFIEACLQEVARSGREGGGLKPLSWKKVGQVLKETHKFDVDRKQMANHLSYLNGKYQAWLKLKNKTGNVYDSSTNTFNLTDEEWEIECKANKYCESLRTTQLVHPELCAQLFNGVIATGIQSYRPHSTAPMLEVSNVEPMVVEQFEEGTQAMAGSSHTQLKKRKRNGKEEVSLIEEQIVAILSLVAAKYAKPDHPTIDECITKLDELGWESNGLLYNVTLAIFSEENPTIRTIWMKLKPERCEDWVKNLAHIKGLSF